MATTGIWKIEGRLDNVIRYTTDINKTENPNYNSSYLELHNVIEYTKSDYKTEVQLYVTGINCSPETAYEDMMITKRQFNKLGGILVFHSFQSFKENEVTPEQAHEIGIRLANEMWGDRFEVVVSTHLNTNHIHNHFVINSVSFKDGKKYYDKRETYAELRHLSDSICEEMGISVLKEKTCESGINYENYYKGKIEKTNYHTLTKEDIDKAILQAYTYKDFETLLKNMGYELIYRSGKLSVRRYPYKKNIRLLRSYGEEYTIDRIKQRIEEERILINKKKPKLKNNQSSKQKNNIHSKLYKLYIHYCYLLKVYPKKYPNKWVSPLIRADVKRMDMLTEETRLLVRNKIETYEQFFLYKESVTSRLDTLIVKRRNLWRQHKKANTEEDKKRIEVEIKELNKQINPLRREVVLCNDIEERTPTMVENLKDNDEVEKKKEKERIEK